MAQLWYTDLYKGGKQKCLKTSGQEKFSGSMVNKHFETPHTAKDLITVVYIAKAYSKGYYQVNEKLGEIPMAHRKMYTKFKL